MDTSHPINTLIPSLAGRVLEVLVGTTRPLSGREISRLVPDGASVAGVAVVLKDLTASGLVSQLEAGNSVLNTLNREHLLAPAILEAVGGHRILIEKLADLAGSVEPAPMHAILFGSVARRQAGPDSDIDLAFVFPDAADIDAAGASVSQLADTLETMTGNHVDALLYSSSEFGLLADVSPDLAEAIRRDGRELLRTNAA
ncbi:MAG: nucleotidyltransferase domain-containing protein [Actinomycetota bacterium]